MTPKARKPQLFQPSGDLARRSKNRSNEVTIHRGWPSARRDALSIQQFTSCLPRHVSLPAPENVTLFAKTGQRSIFFRNLLPSLAACVYYLPAIFLPPPGAPRPKRPDLTARKIPTRVKVLSAESAEDSEELIALRNSRMLSTNIAKSNPHWPVETHGILGFKRIGQGDRRAIAQPQSRFRPVKHPDTRWLIPKMELANFAGLILSN